MQRLYQKRGPFFMTIKDIARESGFAVSGL